MIMNINVCVFKSNSKELGKNKTHLYRQGRHRCSFHMSANWSMHVSFATYLQSKYRFVLDLSAKKVDAGLVSKTRKWNMSSICLVYNRLKKGRLMSALNYSKNVESF